MEPQRKISTRHSAWNAKGVDKWRSPSSRDKNPYKNYKRAKRNFRNGLNDELDRYMSGVFKDIDELSECDVRLFWKLFRRFLPHLSCHCVQWLTVWWPLWCFFCICKAFILPKKIQIIIQTSSLQLKSATVNSNALQAHQMIVSQEVLRPSIQTIIRNIKRRKAPGIDFIQNEHLIHGGVHLARCITHLFNAILEVWYVPFCWEKN